jgi:hypothetical protein
MYSTDNGPHMNTWPDGGMTPFRNEKNTNWEGAYRVPAMVRWPGQDQGGHGAQRIVSPQRLVAHVAGGRRRAGHHQDEAQGRATRLDGTTYKVHLDGYNQLLPHRGQRQEPAAALLLRVRRRRLWALRYDNWKIVFLSSGRPARCRVWAEPYTELRVPKIFNLRSDPYERADITSNTYYDWLDPPGVRHGAGADVRRRVHGDLQGVPAAAEAGEVQRRGRAEEADRGELGQLTSPRLTRRSTGARVPGARSRISRRRPSPTASAGSATAWITKQTTANTASRGPPGTPVPTSATTARF